MDKIVANAEESGYRLLERADFRSAEHRVGGVKGTREALKWIFAAKEGEVSPLYECGENDHLMVVALERLILPDIMYQLGCRHAESRNHQR